MKRVIAALFLCMAATVIAAPKIVSESEEAGRELAERLRSSAPAENMHRKGTLNVRRKRQFHQVPITLEVNVKGDCWEGVYKTTGSSNAPAETLLIVHRPGKPNDYLYSKATRPGEKAGEPTPLKGEEATLSFAGSDFYLTDFGMEFLHWPQQKLTKTDPPQMRSGRPCDLLESRNPKPGPRGYSRTVSWLDKETGGPIIVEAYDDKNKLLKEFSLKGFERIKGEWQLQGMRIANRQTDSTTTLEFQLNK